ncbi:hypothetical protein DMENIID0001_022630 [Sergentomyia squamirostris]
MLLQYHNQLKIFLFAYFKICRFEFLPEFTWKPLNSLNSIRLLICPSHLLFGIFCILWHFFYQMNNYENILDVSMSIVYFFIAYQSMVIYIGIIGNKRKFVDIFTYFDVLIFKKSLNISHLREKHLRNNLKLSLLLSKFFLTVLTCMGVVVVIFNLYRTGFISPMLFTIPGLSVTSSLYKPLNIIYQVVFYFTIIETVIISDVVVMITISYIQGEYSTISDLIAYLDDSSTVPNTKNLLEIIYENHRELLSRVKGVTKIFWHVYFHKLFTITLYFCGTLVLIQSFDGSILIGIMIIVAMVFQLFILCYFGQILENCSQKVAMDLYLTKWYEMTKSDQSSLLIIMITMQKVVRIDTFAFGNVSIYTFVQIIKAAASYATILYTVIE